MLSTPQSRKDELDLKKFKNKLLSKFPSSNPAKFTKTTTNPKIISLSLPKGAKSSNPISEKKRQHLEAIKEREILNEKKQRFLQVLIQRLTSKYGQSSKQLITSFVEEFLRNTLTIRAEDVNQLESGIFEAIQANRINVSGSNPASDNANSSDDPSVPKSNSKSGNSSLSSSTYSSTVSDPGPTTNLPSLRDPSSLTQLSGREWELIREYQIMKAEEQEKEKRERERQRKAEFKRQLDEHLEIAKLEKLKLRQEDKQYAQYVLQDVQRHQIEEAQKVEEQRRQFQQVADIRKQQVDDQHRKLEAEREAKRVHEEKLLRENAILVEKEKQRLQAFKKREHEIGMRIKQDNLDQQKIRAVEDSKQAEIDRVLMQKYAEKLEKEAKEREERARSLLVSPSGGDVESSKDRKLIVRQMFKGLRPSPEELRQEEERQRFFREKQDQLLAERERQNQEARKKKEFEAALENRRMAERRHEEGHKTLDSTRGDTDDPLTLEILAVRREEEERRRRLREEKMHYRQELDAQRTEQSRNRVMMDKGMVDQERYLNSSTLRKVLDDPSVVNRLLNRAPPPSSAR